MLEERFEVSGGWSSLEPLLPVLICFPLGHHSGAPHHQDRAYSSTWQNHLAEHVFQHALDLSALPYLPPCLGLTAASFRQISSFEALELTPNF